MSRLTTCSFIFIISCGQCPIEDRKIVSREDSITMNVTGLAIRFVMRKYFGNVWKCSHTNGAVSIWQDVVRDIAFHIFRGMLYLSEICPSSCGYQD